MHAFIIHRAVLLALVQTICAAPALAGEVIKVNISDLAFAPAEITARVGDSIEWTNGDFVDHTATAKSRDWDITIPAGKSAQVQLNKEATIEYFCRFHPAMTGTIRVTSGGPPH
ncbi:MAG TPA: plastocyanin/azurin family copper-binding protein [Methyloceanibacter sp.]|jgi:plastocyanin